MILAGGDLNDSFIIEGRDNGGFYNIHDLGFLTAFTPIIVTPAKHFTIKERNSVVISGGNLLKFRIQGLK